MWKDSRYAEHDIKGGISHAQQWSACGSLFRSHVILDISRWQITQWSNIPRRALGWLKFVFGAEGPRAFLEVVAHYTNIPN